ncbi:MAG: dihydropteroate synthase [Pirellulaceae bacterium]|nr:dihydropteroate synthase [Pirellulaceae bacterium]
MTNYPNQHYQFITGRIAESAVRSIVAELAAKFGFNYSIQVLPITVAALMTGRWLLRHLQLDPAATTLVLPGYLVTDLSSIQAAVAIPVQCGPKNIVDLPLFFGANAPSSDGLDAYDIEIIAEINHADRLPLGELLTLAQQLAADGADMIDLGCTPGQPWAEVGLAVQLLRQHGLRVSIDSFDAAEVSAACGAGAELVLSVNSHNWQLAADLPCEVVAIPDSPQDIDSLFRTAERLQNAGVSFRLDPILEPIGLGLAASLDRYAQCRRRFPDTSIMMGIGNLTEMTDVDSAGINTLLLGYCQELCIGSVLTTQVINWSRSSVRECDLARRLVHYAVQQGIPAKNIQPQLVTLRDPRVRQLSATALAEMSTAIRDRNIRIFVADGQIHALSAGVHVSGNDPFDVMQQLVASPIGRTLDPEHTFYLGFEMCKASIALALSKNYEQDEALTWGHLTQPEKFHRLKRKA